MLHSYIDGGPGEIQVLCRRQNLRCSLSFFGYSPEDNSYLAKWRQLPGVRLVVILALVGLLCACTPGRGLPLLPDEATGPYKLGPGDVVRVITFGDQQLSETFRVSDSGNIAMPLLGNVRAAGLSVDQLETSISEQLVKKGLYRDPSVTAEITTYRPIFVLGEVAKPGQYPFQPGMTFLTAVAVAGGFTYRAVEDHAAILRQTASRPVEGRAQRETLVQPGDVITVLQRKF
jgi:polysaccharide export outer membrane protein